MRSKNLNVKNLHVTFGTKIQPVCAGRNNLGPAFMLCQQAPPSVVEAELQGSCNTNYFLFSECRFLLSIYLKKKQPNCIIL